VAALWAAVALGCIFGEDGSDRKARSGALTVTVILDKIGTLGKTAKPADIVMSTLVLTATSADEDTLRETLTLTPGSGEYNVKRTFSGLASEKTWSLSAVARDTAGAVIYSADTSFAVVPNATHDITVTLAARYSMLKARLFPIGDKVTSLLMRVNDSLAATAAFAKGSKSGDTVVLAYDYLAASPSGTPHSVRLEVRGDWYGTDTLM